MKNLIILIVLISSSFSAFSQSKKIVENYRKRLESDLQFIYVEKPHRPSSDPTASYKFDNQDIAENNNLTSSFWTNPNNSAMQEFVKLLLQPAGKNRDAIALQYYAGNIMRINDAKVVVWLFNDRNNPNLVTNGFHADWGVTGSTDGSQLTTGSTTPYVWPTGVHELIDLWLIKFAGELKMGATFFADFIDGKEAGFGTFLHELTHTQDNSLFYTPALIPYYYGRDEGHFSNELIGNYYAVYGEAIANAFELLYHRSVNIYDWLNKNQNLHYEHIPASACSGLPTNTCLSTYLSNHPTKVSGTSYVRTYTPCSACAPITFNATDYKMKDLPSDVLVHNEMVQAYIFYAYAKYFKPWRLVNDIIAVKKSTNDAYGFPYLFEQMVNTANNYSNPDKPQQTYGQYLPIAMLDFYTGFELKDQATLDRCLRSTSSSNWKVKIDDYWTSGKRNKLLKLHTKYGKKFSIPLLRDIAIEFNVVSNKQTSATGTP